ncbi:MAG: RnfABCDGE type electron transport complex subunit D [Bacteroidales bacterium]|nr:RnfABCDGE type electron transport complex subunit D [Bacteroidales bacterium]
MSLLTVSGSPHIHGHQSVKSIMYGVVVAMIPAIFVSVYFFGLDAARVIFISIAACLFFEWIIQKYLLKGPLTINDGSALVTGVLLAFNVPSNLPAWMIIVGALVSIGIAKMSFGGLGKNPFNPALIGRVFLLISFPVQMTSWPLPKALFDSSVTDAITGPTTLGILKEGLNAGKSVQELITSPGFPGYLNDLVGAQGGSLGEISAIALLLGAVYMFFRKIITWHIPVGYIGSAVIFSGILWMVDPSKYIDPAMHLMAGGMILGVFFMATDMVSTPMSPKGQIVFGIGAGLLTIIIRVWGAYPEGVSFAILIMNAFTPLINKGFKPKRFGEVLSKK